MLTEAEITARLNAYSGGTPTVPPAPVAPKKPTYQHIKPISDQIEAWIDWVQDPREHWQLGLTPIDMLIRGFRPSEMVMVQGFSQSGKSQVLLTSVLMNEKPFLWVTFDETGEMVVGKLVAMVTRQSAEDIERDIKARDKKTLDMVRGIANERFGKYLIVLDKQGGLGQVDHAISEAEDYFGEALRGLSVDYLGVMPSEKDREDGRAFEFKAWANEKPFPCFVIHQNSRTNGGPGKKPSMTSGKFGGEDACTIMIGVRRKQFDETLPEYDRTDHERRGTISVSVVKNKRPPARLGEYDFHMDPLTGLVLPLAPQDGRDPDPPPVSAEVTWDEPSFSDDWDDF